MAANLSFQVPAGGSQSSKRMSEAAEGLIEPATRQNGLVAVAEPPPPFGLVKGAVGEASTGSAVVMTVSTAATL